MFDYSYNFTLPCQPCTAEEFEKLVTSAKVRSAIAKARECEAAIRQLGDDADENSFTEPGSRSHSPARAVPLMIWS